MTFIVLQACAINIGLGSGFLQNVGEIIVSHLKWLDLVDFISSAEQEGKGRPFPTPINRAMNELAIYDCNKVVKASDTSKTFKKGRTPNVGQQQC